MHKQTPTQLSARGFKNRSTDLLTYSAYAIAGHAQADTYTTLSSRVFYVKTGNCSTDLLTRLAYSIADHVTGMQEADPSASLHLVSSNRGRWWTVSLLCLDGRQ